jgi:superfamily II DNA or RNA helicase
MELTPGSPSVSILGNAQEIEGLLSLLEERHNSVFLPQNAAGCKPTHRRPWSVFDMGDGVHLRLCVLIGTALGTFGELMPWPHPRACRHLLQRINFLRELGWREYQLEAIAYGCAALYGRGVLKLAAGAGKTMVAHGLAFCVGGSWLYIVYGKALVKQAQESFEKLSSCVRDRGYRGPDILVTGYNKSVISDVDAGWSGLIVDECHQVAAKQRAGAIAAFDGPFRIGLSATPFERLDGNNALVEGLLGPLLYEVSAQTLLKNGYLTKGSYKQILV